MDKKHTIVLIFICLATLIVMIIGATYAYLASKISVSNSTPIGAQTPPPTAVFLTTSSDNIKIDVSAFKMQQSNISDTDAPDDLTANANLTVYLSAAEDQKVSTCSYNVIYELGKNSSEYVRTPGVEKEFTISSKVLSVINVPTLDATDPNYPLFEMASPNLLETNFDELNWQTRDITVGIGEEAKTKQVRYANLIEGAKISSMDKNTYTIVNYGFEIKFYNASRDQSNLRNKNFTGSIKVDNNSINCHGGSNE